MNKENDMERLFFYPERVCIEVYHGCNAECTMCPVHKSARQRGSMRPEVFSEILRQLSDFKDRLRVTSLLLTGEPLLDKYLENRIAQCKSIGFNNVGFATNASLLSANRAEQIMDAAPDWIAFSFDSLDKAIYESIRVGLKFDEVYNNILNFIEIRNKRKRNTRISMRFIDQAKVSGQFNDYFETFKNLLTESQDEILVLPFQNWGAGEDGMGMYGNSPCNDLLDRVVICKDGTVPLCCVDYNAAYNLGNIMERPLLDIWNGRQLHRIRKIHSSGRRGTMLLCGTCSKVEQVEKRYHL